VDPPSSPRLAALLGNRQIPCDLDARPKPDAVPVERGRYNFEDDVVCDLIQPEGIIDEARDVPRVEFLLVDLDGDDWPELVRYTDGSWWQRENDRLVPFDELGTVCGHAARAITDSFSASGRR
jgi:hypothetical protein